MKGTSIFYASVFSGIGWCCNPIAAPYTCPFVLLSETRDMNVIYSVSLNRS